MKIPFQHQSLRPENLKSYISEIKDAAVAEASDPVATKDRVRYAIGPENRHRVVGNWVTRIRQPGQTSLIRDLANNMLISPAPGELQEFKEDAWVTICDLDARRQRNENCATILGSDTFESVRKIAADPDHPRHADAKLLSDIMTRPLGENPPSLESYLSGLISSQVKKTMHKDFETSPVCDFTKPNDVILFTRTFNSIMQSVTLNSQDYTSIGRTLILKGATHLSTWSDLPPPNHGDNTDTLTNELLAVRLHQATFCFPTVPAEGSKLMHKDFNTEFNFDTMEMDPNPLEEKFGMQFYLDSKSYRVIEPVAKPVV